MRGTTGGNNSDLTEMNRSAVVKILQRQEICSRASIARQTGLTQAAITKIIATLMDMGIVTEVGSIKGSGNRRSIGLKLNANRHQVIGVKFARQMFAVGVFDISGKMYTETETEYSIDESPKAVLAAMKAQIHKALRDHESVVAIGIAVPGPYLRTEGRIALVTQMSTWHDINFLEEFKEEFDKPVFIEHDAKAGALAEWWFGDHDRQLHTLAYMLVGEGVGSGVIEDGHLLMGTQGIAAETGHISVDVCGPRCECGNYGCLELYCSAAAMIKRMEQRATSAFAAALRKSDNACHDIFEAARSGDEAALAVVRETAEYIGYGCVTLINAYNPDVITIGDSVSQGGGMLLATVREVVKNRTIPELYRKVQIKISTLKIDPTLYGAAAIATDQVLQLPSAFTANLKKGNGAKK